LSAFVAVDGEYRHGKSSFAASIGAPKKDRGAGLGALQPMAASVCWWGGLSRCGRLVASGKRSVTAGVVDGIGLP
jgi:hypothetical protein